MAQRTITDCLGRWVVVERDDMEDGRIHQGAVIEIDHHSFTFSGFAKHLGLSPLNRCFDIDEIREDEDRVVMEGVYTVEDATLTLSWDAEGQVIADAVGCDVFGWTVTVPVIRASSSRRIGHPNCPKQPGSAREAAREVR